MSIVFIILLIGSVLITIHTVAKGLIEKKISDTLAEAAKEVEKNMASVQGGGIGCDNPTCNYVDRNVKTDDFKNWIDKPCPECGENLLTQEDFDRSENLLDMIEKVNNMSQEDIQGMMKQVDIGALMESPFFQGMSKADKDELQDLAQGMAGGSAGEGIFDREIFISTHNEIKIDSVVRPSESAYILTRDVNQSECDWLERDFPYGEIVYRYFGDTDGEISSTGFAFSLEKGQTPYFELPINAVELVDSPQSDGMEEEDGS
jgi:hypothetical protein